MFLVLLCASQAQGRSLDTSAPGSSAVGAAAQTLTQPHPPWHSGLPLGSTRGLGYKGSLFSAAPNPPVVSVVVSHCHSPGHVRGGRQVTACFRELPADDPYRCLPALPRLPSSFQSRASSLRLKSVTTFSDACVKFSFYLVIFCVLRVPPRPELLSVKSFPST